MKNISTFWPTIYCKYDHFIKRLWIGLRNATQKKYVLYFIVCKLNVSIPSKIQSTWEYTTNLVQRCFLGEKKINKFWKVRKNYLIQLSAQRIWWKVCGFAVQIRKTVIEIPLKMIYLELDYEIKIPPYSILYFNQWNFVFTSYSRIHWI